MREREREKVILKEKSCLFIRSVIWCPFALMYVFLFLSSFIV